MRRSPPAAGGVFTVMVTNMFHSIYSLTRVQARISVAFAVRMLLRLRLRRRKKSAAAADVGRVYSWYACVCVCACVRRVGSRVMCTFIAFARRRLRLGCSAGRLKRRIRSAAQQRARLYEINRAERSLFSVWSSVTDKTARHLTYTHVAEQNKHYTAK